MKNRFYFYLHYEIANGVCWVRYVGRGAYNRDVSTHNRNQEHLKFIQSKSFNSIRLVENLSDSEVHALENEWLSKYIDKKQISVSKKHLPLLRDKLGKLCFKIDLLNKSGSRVKFKPIPEEIREYLVVDPESRFGLRWKLNSSDSRGSVGAQFKEGQEAGSISKTTGYAFVGFKGVLYKCHRVVYLLFHGVDPAENLVDHKDRDKLNNRPENLVLSNVSSNNKNMSKRSDNTSGTPNIRFDKTYNCWFVRWYENFKRKVGTFSYKTKYKHLPEPQAKHQAFLDALEFRETLVQRNLVRPLTDKEKERYL